MATFLLCDCDLGTGKALPPHLHYMAGLITRRDGSTEWVGGAITDERKEFVSMDIRMPVEELAALFGTPSEGEK